MQEETLYDFMLVYLKHNSRCEVCGERLWVGYTDGHVWNRCLACPEPEFPSLDLAGYITCYPVPTVPLPDSIEVRPFDDGELPPWREAHEQYYRMKNICGEK